VTLLAFAVGSYFVPSPVASAAYKPVFAASTDRTVPNLALIVHKELFERPLF
jgi:hypothetical protein